MAGFTYILVAVIIMSCSISQGNSYEPATILEEVGALFHPIGRLITSQDKLFVHIAIPRSTHLNIPGRITLETDCGMPNGLKRDEDLILYMRNMCMEFYNAIMVYNTTATSITHNINNKLEDINIALESIPKMTEANKRVITAVIGLIKGAVDIGMSIHTNRRIDSLMASVSDINSVSQRNNM